MKKFLGVVLFCVVEVFAVNYESNKLIITDESDLNLVSQIEMKQSNLEKNRSSSRLHSAYLLDQTTKEYRNYNLTAKKRESTIGFESQKSSLSFIPVFNNNDFELSEYQNGLSNNKYNNLTHSAMNSSYMNQLSSNQLRGYNYTTPLDDLNLYGLSTEFSYNKNVLFQFSVSGNNPVSYQQRNININDFNAVSANISIFNN